MANSSSLANMSLANACAQSLPFPQLAGIQVLNISATLATNISYEGTPNVVATKSVFSGLNFCNVSVDYTHPGYDDAVTTYLYLPDPALWNGRMAAAGGGGWGALSGDYQMIPLLDRGFAVAETNGGVPFIPLDGSSWALAGNNTGNPDIELLNTFASRALHEMAVIGKDVTESFFAKAPSRSYFMGCSQGGRQGNMLAQRYPEDFDGIAAVAPAINWGPLFGSLIWTRQLMYELNYFPPLCELQAITVAAVQACDGDDGLTDGIISDINCKFDPLSLSGRSYNCNGINQTYNDNALKIMKGTWGGTRNIYGEPTWYGLGLQADLSGTDANTTCTTPTDASTCAPNAFPLADTWFRYWVAADPSFSFNLSRAEFSRLSQLGSQEYDSIIGTRDPDIRAFRDAGGKMLNWHGIADQLIPFKGSIDYYNRVKGVDASADDYFRLFLVPGAGHCSPGAGAFPFGALDTLMNWVENGVAPQTLRAINVTTADPTTGAPTGPDAAGQGRLLCPYPEVQHYKGGDRDMLSSWDCVSTGKGGNGGKGGKGWQA